MLTTFSSQASLHKLANRGVQNGPFVERSDPFLKAMVEMDTKFYNEGIARTIKKGAIVDSSTPKNFNYSRSLRKAPSVQELMVSQENHTLYKRLQRVSNRKEPHYQSLGQNHTRRRNNLQANRKHRAGLQQQERDRDNHSLLQRIEKAHTKSLNRQGMLKDHEKYANMSSRMRRYVDNPKKKKRKYMKKKKPVRKVSVDAEVAQENAAADEKEETTVAENVEAKGAEDGESATPDAVKEEAAKEEDTAAPVEEAKEDSPTSTDVAEQSGIPEEAKGELVVSEENEGNAEVKNDEKEEGVEEAPMKKQQKKKKIKKKPKPKPVPSPLRDNTPALSTSYSVQDLQDFLKGRK